MAENVTRSNWAPSVELPLGGTATHNHQQQQQHQQQHHQQQQQQHQQLQHQHGNIQIHHVSSNQRQHEIAQYQQKQQQQQSNQVLLPKTVILRRQDGHGFGFTLRHFIVYPPESCSESSSSSTGPLSLVQPMDTVFVKEVRAYGPAYSAGLKTGDRLLAVNGMPVAGTPYARVVAAIQQTPSTLTLQVVPKECDILQTFFSETAHNPETNQRPRIYSPQRELLSSTKNEQLLHQQQQQHKQQRLIQNQIVLKRDSSIGDRTGGSDSDVNCERIYSEPYSGYDRPKAEPQAPMITRRRGDEIIQVHQAHATNIGNGQMRLQQQQQQQQHINQQQHAQMLLNRSLLNCDHDRHDRRESSASVTSSIGSYDSGSTLTSDLGDCAIMSRLRKSLEQKEEFLRRPSQPTGYIAPDKPQKQNDDLNVQCRQREFYARPNRLQKQIWPPQESPNNKQENFNKNQEQCENNVIEIYNQNNLDTIYLDDKHNNETVSQRMKQPININNNININNIKNNNNINNNSKEVVMPLQTMSTNIIQQQQQQQQKLQQEQSAHKIANHLAREQFYNGIQQQQHHDAKQIQSDHNNSMETEDNCRFIPTTGLHIVSERAKQFESGRPLSPDSNIDRTSLYASELSRLSTKRPVPNVAVRKREFELKAENSEWRKTSDDNDRSSSFDTTSESSIRHPTVRARSLSADSSRDPSLRNERSQVYTFTDEQLAREFSRKPYRQNSYIEAVRQSQAYGPQQPQDQQQQLQQHQQLQQQHQPQSHNQQQLQKLMPEIKTNYTDVCLRNNQLNGQPQTKSQLIQKEMKLANRNQTILTSVRLTSDPNVLIDFSEINALKQFSIPMELIQYKNDQIMINNVMKEPMIGSEKDIEMRNIDLSGCRSPPVRPTTLNLITDTNQVIRRQKPVIEDDERPMRRVSYLRATANESALHIESDMDQSPMSLAPDTETDEPTLHSLKSHGSKSKALSYLRDTPPDPALPIQREGELHVKVTCIDGKRSQDRSWRLVWAEIRGNKLKLTIHREGKSSQSPEPSGIIDLRSFHVTEGNYTKRKHVFKLTSAISTSSPSSSSTVSTSSSQQHNNNNNLVNNGRELLLQADNHNDMKLWMDTLRSACGHHDSNGSGSSGIRSEEYLNNLGTQTAEPQRVAATTIVHTPTSDEVSPVPPTKTLRKYGLGSRSPSGQSPVTKSRKTPQQTNVTSTQKDSSDKEIGSPKSKTWKGLVARQFRKIQGQPGSPHSNFNALPEGASIGVPLIHCPASDEDEYVPYIVTQCTMIVESRGLSVVGIYRIPGNTANITALTEQVNRGFDDQTLNDPKWEDVNVVSSLLKLFIRSLPDGLLPNEMYSSFINADKQAGTNRLLEIKALLNKLPPHCYHTLKHLIKHLNLVSHHCEVNLMEPRNLAIVFGPSVVRTSNDTLETAVKDMKHQCRIVEAFVSHYLFFFENDPIPQISEISEPISEMVPEAQQTSLLLDNVSKIELFSALREKESSSRFVANIVQAANRKIRRTAHRKSTMSSATPDTLSLDSSTSAESKEQMKRFGSDDSSQHGGRGMRSETDLTMPKARLSEDDSNDCAFADNGSMSLTTVTITLDNKLRSLRNASLDSELELVADKNKKIHSQPLTLGENIPFADESPERPIIQTRSKPIRSFNNENRLLVNRNDHRLTSQSSTPPNSPKDILSSRSESSQENVNIDKTLPRGISSDETDASTTSNPREIIPTMRIDTEVLREMNRILTNLERKATKLNRSLSLNYKSHKGECCCNNNHRTSNRFSLTKDEKTDKNISKKRQLQDIKNHRRHTAGNRSIKRRHTVGGTHDYSTKNPTNHDSNTPCQGYVSTRTSSPDLLTKNDENISSNHQEQENCHH